MYFLIDPTHKTLLPVYIGSWLAYPFLGLIGLKSEKFQPISLSVLVQAEKNVCMTGYNFII